MMEALHCISVSLRIHAWGKPIKLSQKTVRFQDVNKLDVWHISDDMVIDLEELTCAIYGKSRHKSVHDLRYSILK